MLGLQKLSESVRDYTYLIQTSQTSTRGPSICHEARNLNAQRTFLNTFKNIVNRRVNIPKDIQRFQKTLQCARSKVDYVIGEFIYMLPSDMNLWIGKVKNYNNKILISSPSFKIGTNVKINLDGKKDEPDVKSNKEQKPNTVSNKEHKPDIKLKQDVKPNTDSNKEHKQDTEPDIKCDKITYEEEKVALVLGITSIFTVWWLFK